MNAATSLLLMQVSRGPSGGPSGDPYKGGVRKETLDEKHVRLLKEARAKARREMEEIKWGPWWKF